MIAPPQDQSQANFLEELAARVRAVERRQSGIEQARLEAQLGVGTPSPLGGSLGGLPLMAQGVGPIDPAVVLQPGAVIGNSFANGAIGNLTPFATSIRPVLIVASLPVLPDSNYPVETVVVLTTTHRLYKNVANVWQPVVDAIDLSGQITSTQITDLAVSTPKLAANAVTAAKIAAGTITASEIAADTITAAQIAAGAINSSELASGAVTTGKLSVGGISGPQSLVPNFSFEDETSPGSLFPANWAAQTLIGAGSGVALDTGAAKHGVRRLLLSVPLTTGKINMESDKFPVVAGENLYMSTWYLGAGGLATNNVYIGMMFYNSAGVQVSYVDLPGGSSLASPSVWTKAEGYITVPANATQATAWVCNQTPNVASNILVYDQVIVQRTAGGVRNPDGSVTIDASGITVVNGKITLQDEFGSTSLVAAGFSNNWATFIASGLYNAALRAGIAGALPVGRTSSLPYWTFTQTTGTPTLTYTAPSGGTNGQVASTLAVVTDVATLTSDAVVCEQLTPYSLRVMAWGANVAGTTTTLTAYIDFYKWDGTLNASSSYVVLSMVGAQTLLRGWYQGPRMLSPAGTATMKVRLVWTAATGVNAGNVLRVDSVTIAREPLPSTIGTAFPTSPVIGDIFTRTDLLYEDYYWDGTRWLSKTIYSIPLGEYATGWPVAATGFPAIVPVPSNSVGTLRDIWLIGWTVVSMVQTTNNGTNFWTVALAGDSAGTFAGSFTTAADTVGVQTVHRNAIAAVAGTGRIYMNVTKTLAPGGLYAPAILEYRKIAT